LGLALWQVPQMRNLGTRKERSSSIGTGSHTCTTSNTCCRIHRQIRILLTDRQGVRILGRASGDRNIASSSNDAIKGTPVHYQILDDWECRSTPRFNPDLITILEMAHMQLADSCVLVSTMSNTVNHEAAGTTDSFTTIMLKCDGFITLVDQLFIDDI